MDDSELKKIVEAALFVAGRPLSFEDLAALFPEDQRPAREQIQGVLTQLAEDCQGRGIELREIDRGFRFQTRTRYAEWVNRLFEERPARYSRAVLETLAIIAYRQPVTRAEIEDIRGVGVSTEIIKALTSREWIRQVGQKDVPGRPALYGTTRAFLEYFDLGSLDQLPPLSDVRALELVELDTVDVPAAGAPASASHESAAGLAHTDRKSPPADMPAVPDASSGDG
ncbi:MAG TPA: SMC-Scp complex subunit ScpB [Acidiferrobacteraceae bacterium]|nr:SMC-Scp complex subunit ScpB [Acidiferrobacteraceae bacterium]